MKQVVCITGGSSGIGKAIGEFLVEKGYVVYGTSRNPSRYPESKFPLLAMEVTNSESIKQALSELLKCTSRIDILINNAGVGITGPIEETPLEEIENAFQTNFLGPMAVIQGVLPIMRTQQSGLILNITSIAGYMGLPYRGIYSATKAALEIATEALRMEVKGFGIQCTNIAPGDFATNIASGRYHAPATKNSPYLPHYQNTLDLMDAHVDQGSDPQQMAFAVYKIIQSKNLKVHYRIGLPLQRFSVFLKRVLPDRLYEKILMKHYKL